MFFNKFDSRNSSSYGLTGRTHIWISFSLASDLLVIKGSYDAKTSIQRYKPWTGWGPSAALWLCASSITGELRWKQKLGFTFDDCMLYVHIDRGSGFGWELEMKRTGLWVAGNSASNRGYFLFPNYPFSSFLAKLN